jgi:hypothetical protein
MEAMQEYYATSIAEQQRLKDSLQEVQQQLQQLQTEHAGCQAARCVAQPRLRHMLLHAAA